MKVLIISKSIIGSGRYGFFKIRFTKVCRKHHKAIDFAMPPLTSYPFLFSLLINNENVKCFGM